MKWIGIVGSWRLTDKAIEGDVRKRITTIFQETNNGVVSGGALGVDYIAIDEALKHDPSGHRIKVILPTSLQAYRDYFNRRAETGVVTHDQANILIKQLEEIQNRHPSSLVELEHETVYRKTFHSRNREVVKASDEIFAYQVNGSTGTQNTVNTAKKLEKPVTLYRYSFGKPRALIS